ncbi:DNA alkylation repair protein [Fodinibius sediminis]|uniref:3-methyladenine DNA glycosylase AlkD n=1 Tax=Fodinibius sediminis TaxID=1214077 RepID=A0A521F5T1_9BACT|nr:DNA alkylation repair protein [Fodinibius sediminis]SMO91545.1 3-methyladenine DNA glycosylase AlkD [Fodinibius sediminis]
MNHTSVQYVLRDMADPEIADHSKRFFKTGKGEYGEGDRFLGIRVPRIRKVARRFAHLPLDEIEHLLHSVFHEERLCALIMLVLKSKKADSEQRKRLYDLYLNNTKYINNWDLVDTSAEHIVGRYLENKDRKILYDLARSENLWERRIAIMSTFPFIRANDFYDPLSLAEILVSDGHDLIHKAVGWMLREIGNQERRTEELFLDRHAPQMPRTMLRYAVEKFPEERRQYYLNI